MKNKTKSILTLLLTLLLIISNMGNQFEALAKENNDLITKQTQENISGKLESPTGLHVKDKSTNCIAIEWNKVKCATGYNIYRSSLKNGIYLKVGQVCQDNTYVDRDLESGKNYFYKVKAFKKVGDKKCFGYSSDVLYATTCPEVVNNLRADCITNCFIQISWTTVEGASGYEVYRSNCKNGKYEKIATKIDGKQTFYKDYNLKKSTKYYYKVRAFKELNGKFTFGQCSEILETCTE